MVRFSERTAWSRRPNALRQLLDRLHAVGSRWLDLTSSNPSEQGFSYDESILRQVHARATLYTPDPLGLPEARRAIAELYYGRRGDRVEPRQIWVASGTSELYAHLMAILCDPGDEWLIPMPGYPLFDYMADLMGVRLVGYPLRWDGRWHLDMAEFAQLLAARPRARAAVVISPHNPTGHVVTRDEFDAISARCAELDRALLVDEVFLDYPIAASDRGTARLPSLAGKGRGLTIVLSGLSKVAAYPQGKVAWAVVSGPEADVAECLARAEIVSDIFLTTSTTLQQGVAALLEAAPVLQERIRQRCRENLEFARETFRGTPVSVLEPEAGWYLLTRWPAAHDDQGWALRALEEERVLVHPGYLFGMEQEFRAPILGLSLLVRPEIFREGLDRLARVART